MSKQRFITEDLIKRISKVDAILSEWMHNENYGETDPEECIAFLVRYGI